MVLALNAVIIVDASGWGRGGLASFRKHAPRRRQPRRPQEQIPIFDRKRCRRELPRERNSLKAAGSFPALGGVTRMHVLITLASPERM
jgi:hypothetical protein